MAGKPQSFEYQVVFEGRIIDGYAPGDVRAAFGIRFGDAAANTVFSQPRIVLKQKLALEQAEKIRSTLTGIGMQTKVERLPVAPAELRLVDEPATPAPGPEISSPPDPPPPGDSERDRGLIEGRTLARGKPARTHALPEIEAAFPAALELAPPSTAYRTRLVGVAAVMLMLPLVYVAIAFASLFGVYWLAMPGREAFFAAVRPGYLTVVLFGAAFLAAVLISAFLFKPLLSRRESGLQAVSLEPGREPVLFALVEKITEATGAPMPEEILVDVNVNASASLTRGVFSQQLTLTIGLPLFWGLDVRSLSGVLAHEFGHFAQRWGMRASAAVFGINHWFYRQVHERDRWDLFVERLAQRDIALFGLAALLAQVGSGLCRTLLAGLAHLASLVSLSFSRQMEFDADRYEVALVGSKAYEDTAIAMRLLVAAEQRVHGDIGSALAAGTQVDNVPRLVARRARQFGDKERRQVLDGIEKTSTSVFDTHPADQDRIRAAREQQAASQFAFEGGAEGLLRELDRLSRVATLQWYRSLGLDVQPADLVSVASFEVEERELERATRAGEKYFGSLAALPVWLDLPDAGMFAGWSDAELAAQSASMRDQLQLDRKEYLVRRDQLELNRDYLSCYGHARFWAKLGMPVDPAAYKRRIKAGSLQEIDAHLAEHRNGSQELERELSDFAGLLGRQLAADLELAGRRDPGCREEIAKLCSEHAALGRAAGKERTLIASSELLAVLVDAGERLDGDARRQREVARELAAETQRNEHLQDSIRQVLDPNDAGTPAPPEGTDPAFRARQALDDAGRVLHRLERRVRATRGRLAELALTPIRGQLPNSG